MKKFLLAFVGLLLAANLQAQGVQTGIEQLRSQGFKILEGKKVGLITNPTGVDSRLKSTIDILHAASNVNMVALYGPEHGVRGDHGAGDHVDDDKDKVTGLPVFSLYGASRKPSPEILRGVDVLVYDIQDIGSRSYTYISTLGLVMEAAAENNIEVVVLDRPNPVGGLKMEGLITEPAFTSFVSQFPIPYLHGLTVGELAKYLNGEKLLANGVQCKLTVVPMKEWKRSMNFEQTGLPWVPSSPHIPYSMSAYFYPMTGILGELSHVNIGVGYTMPFQTVATDWIKDPMQLAQNLNALKVPGVIFRPIFYKPYYSHFKDTFIGGVQVHLMDYKQVPLSLVQFYIMQECYKMYPEQNIFTQNKEDRIKMFDQVCGSDKVRKTFVEGGFQVAKIKDMWMGEIPAYKKKAIKYMLYK